MYDDDEIRDVSEKYPWAMKAERKGKNTLVLERLENPVKRLDGQWADYQLTYYWHQDCQTDGVLGDDYSYWIEGEFDPAMSLFEEFQMVS